MLGASCALMLSGAPFEGPIGAVRVSKDENGNMIANPTHKQADASDLDIVVAGTHDSVIMVEAGCKFVTEDDIMNAVEFAQVEIRKQCEAQLEFAKACGVVKEEFVNPYDTSELAKIIEETAHDMIFDAYHNFDREYRQNKLEEAKKLVKEKVEAAIKELEDAINKAPIETITKEQAEEIKKKQEELMKAAEEVYKKAYEEEMKKQQAGGQAGAGPDPNAGASDSNASGGNSNPGDDVVDGDFKEV